MNTWQLAEDFRKAFEDSPSFSYPQLHGQGAGDFEAPANVFLVTEDPLSMSGSAAKFTLAVEVNSLATRAEESDPDPDAVHGGRVAAVVDMLMKDGKSALLIALRSLGRWDLRGWCAAPEDPNIQGTRFVTPVRIVGTVVQV